MTEKDYNRIADELLLCGSKHQKKCIRWYRQNSSGRLVTSDMRDFIDRGIKLGLIRG